MFEQSDLPKLKRLGVKDSKLLSHKKRVLMYDKITAATKSYKIMILQPEEIDDALNSDSLNLNWLEAVTSAKIINFLKPERITIDCPNPNVASYGRYLMRLLDNRMIDAVIEHKADVNHVECSAASILAKVTRDAEIEKIKKDVGDFGSGYLTDPKTIKFFEENFERFPEIFRKTWAPYKARLEMKLQRSLPDFGF